MAKNEVRSLSNEEVGAMIVLCPEVAMHLVETSACNDDVYDATYISKCGLWKYSYCNDGNGVMVDFYNFTTDGEWRSIASYDHQWCSCPYDTDDGKAWESVLKYLSWSTENKVTLEDISKWLRDSDDE